MIEFLQFLVRFFFGPTHNNRNLVLVLELPAVARWIMGLLLPGAVRKAYVATERKKVVETQTTGEQCQSRQQELRLHFVTYAVWKVLPQSVIKRVIEDNRFDLRRGQFRFKDATNEELVFDVYSNWIVAVPLLPFSVWLLVLEQPLRTSRYLPHITPAKAPATRSPNDPITLPLREITNRLGTIHSICQRRRLRKPTARVE